MTLILASGSESRRRILAAAGVDFSVEPPSFDEAPLKAALGEEHAGADIVAMTLAEGKALSVSGRHRHAWVIGGDQLLVCEGRLFDKVRSLEAAREVLMALRGREHRLVAAVTLAHDGQVRWRHAETVHLWMREFSDAFLESYLVDEGVGILSSVGCYRVEGRGVQLFHRVDGDHSAIRGLPLLPLLAALRRFEVLPS
jgi:septum formation protein